MSAGYFDKPIRFASGLIAAGAAIEVRDTSGALVDIFSNASLTTPLSNPGVVGADGRYEFYALFGVYDITVGTGASAATYRFKLAGDNVNFLTRADFVSAVADGYAPSGGTVVTIGSLSWMVIPVGHAAYGTDPISDLPGWMAVGAWTPEHHGASGDGATDDTVALQEWLDAVGDDVAQADPSKVYVISDTLSVSGVGLRLRGKLRLFKNSNGKALELQNTVYGPYSLASDYAAGDLSIDLTGSPLAAAPKSGQAFKIVSDAVDPRNRDEGSSARQYRSGEWFVVGEGSTATNLVLQAPLQFATGISPTSTAGDEARIDAYTTAMAARVVMIDMDAAVEIDGVDVEYEDGHEGDPWTGAAVRIVGYADPKITFAVTRSYGPGLSMCNYGGEVRGTARRCEDNTAQGQYGYGVSDNGSFGLKVYGLTGHDNRHLYTSAATRLAAGEADAINLLGAGRTQSAQIIGGHGSGGKMSVWDTHQSSDGAQFSSIVATASTSYAGAFRGRDVSVSNLTARGTYRGVQFFTEYDSGDTDDDLFTAGKTVDDFSSGALTDARIECREHVIKVFHADVEVSGNGEYVSEDHTLLMQIGGRVVISGTHKFKVTGAAGDAGISIFDLDNVNAAASAVWSVTELVIAPGAYIEIDATEAASGVALFGLESNCRVVCYGTVIADMPDAASSFANGAGDGNISVLGGGLIRYFEGGSLVDERREHFHDGTVAAPGVRFAADEDTGLYRPASNQLATAVGGVQRTLLSSTAYQIDVPITGAAVQSDFTDATSGRLLKVGAFGLGGSDLAQVRLDDGQQDLPSGFYAGGGSSADPTTFPSGNAQYKPFLNLTRRVASGNYGQVRMYFGETINIYEKSALTAAWEPMHSLVSREQLLGTVSQTGGLPTGAVIERGANANGEYVRFADGTQICTYTPGSFLNATESTGNIYQSTSPGSWVFPAQFVSAPVCTASPRSDIAWANCQATSTTTASVRMFSPTSLVGALTQELKAVGRWY